VGFSLGWRFLLSPHGGIIVEESISPPAIVKTAVAELMKQAKSLNDDIKAYEKHNLKKAVELGKLLVQAKEQTRHGDWLPAIKKVGIIPVRACIFMKLAKCNAQHISNCSSIREAQRAIQAAEDEEDQEPEEQSGPDDPSELTDDLDRPVPIRLKGVFQKAEIFKDVDQAITEAKKALDSLKQEDAGKQLHHGNNFQAIEITIRDLKRSIKHSKPYAVCPMKDRDHDEHCACKGLRWLTKIAYDTLPQEFRS
jgi:hypothetical protein